MLPSVLLLIFGKLQDYVGRNGPVWPWALSYGLCLGVAGFVVVGGEMSPIASRFRLLLLGLSGAAAVAQRAGPLALALLVWRFVAAGDCVGVVFGDAAQPVGYPDISIYGCISSLKTHLLR